MTETFTWPRVREWAEKEIERLRVKNDSTELDLPQTYAIRGEIRALKRLIGLPQEEARKAQMTSTAQMPPGY